MDIPKKELTEAFHNLLKAIGSRPQTGVEHEIFERELESFVPDKVLDAHAHMWPSTAPDSDNQPKAWLQEHVTLELWREMMNDQMPHRDIGGLMLAVPHSVHGLAPATNESVTRHAEHIAGEVLSEPLCQPTMFVAPQLDPDYVKQEARRLNIKGLKVYHTESPNKPTWEAEIPEYLPEAMVQVADDLGICITLHMVKERSVSDPSNQHWIRTYCEKYPNMKLILAHAARSFNPVWAMEGISTLRGLPNLYCDTSAIGEVGACEAIIEHLGHDHLVWATDFPVTHMLGIYVAVGIGMRWLGPETDTDPAGVNAGFVHNGLEQLRVIKQAVWHQRLTDSQVEDVFFNNLAQIIDVV